MKSNSIMHELDSLQNLFYRVLLQVPMGCPIPMMYWDCAGLSMKNRILQKKLMFLLHHVANLDKESIANQIYCTQKRLMLPGLVEECSEMLVKWQVCDITQYSPGQWKTLVKKKMEEKSTNDLLENMKRNYKKIDHNVMMKEKSNHT